MASAKTAHYFATSFKNATDPFIDSAIAMATLSGRVEPGRWVDGAEYLRIGAKTMVAQSLLRHGVRIDHRPDDDVDRLPALHGVPPNNGR